MPHKAKTLTICRNPRQVSMKISGAATGLTLTSYLNIPVVVLCECPGPPASLLGASDLQLHCSLLTLCLPTEKRPDVSATGRLS